MKRWHKVGFIAVLVLSVFLRFYRLGDIPEGFHSDEAAFGYNAYSILKTGRDEYGTLLPLTLRSFGDYKAALYSYITIPFVVLVGLNEFATRAPSAVFGVVWVVVMYAFVRSMTGNRNYALAAMALSSISPLPVLLSRVQSDPLVSVVFILIGSWLFFYWIEKKSAVYIYLAALSWLASSFTYVLPRMFLLVYIPGLFFWFRKSITGFRKVFMWGVCVFTCGSILLLTITSSSARWTQVSVFHAPGVQLLLDEKIREDGVMRAPYLSTRLFHNKVIDYGRYFLENYFSYMDFRFLFYEAGQPLREKIPSTGVMLLIELPFLLIGTYVLLNRKYHWGYFCLLWAFGAPLLLSLTRDEIPNIHRFFLASAPFTVITGVGLVASIRTTGKKVRYIAIVIIGSLFVFNVLYFLHNLWIHQPIHEPVHRAYTYKPLVLEMKRRAVEFDVVVSQKLLEHMLFYWAVDPAQYIGSGSPRDENDQWVGKYLFVATPCPSQTPDYASMSATQRVLYVDKAECRVKNEEIIDTIRWRGGLPAFYLVEKKPLETDE